MVLDPWEQDVLHDALHERPHPDGRWEATEVGVVVTRQNGKGSILEARELGGLFLLDEKLITHTAHRFDTCLEHFRRIRTLIESTPDLDRKVKKIKEANGDESIELKSGARLLFKARSKGSGRGFGGDCVVLDEAFYLHDLGSMLPTMSARPNPQVWYTSSAPLPQEESDILRRLCRRGRKGTSPRLVYVEFCAAHDPKNPVVDLDDRDNWRAANPGLGIRVSEEFVEIERQSMTDEEFARERLGVWADNEDDAEGVISKADWKAGEVKTWEMGVPAFALDVTPDRSFAAIAAGSDPAVDIVDHNRGTGWVVDRLVQLTADHENRGVVVDPMGAAGNLIEKLEAAGVTVVPVTVQEHKQACADIFDDIIEHRLRHPTNPSLEAAAMNVTQRNVGDAWLWDRRKSGVDICPLVAATLALWGSRRPVETEPEMAAPDVVLL